MSTNYENDVLNITDYIGRSQVEEYIEKFGFEDDFDAFLDWVTNDDDDGDLIEEVAERHEVSSSDVRTEVMSVLETDGTTAVYEELTSAKAHAETHSDNEVEDALRAAVYDLLAGEAWRLTRPMSFEVRGVTYTVPAIFDKGDLDDAYSTVCEEVEAGRRSRPQGWEADPQGAFYRLAADDLWSKRDIDYDLDDLVVSAEREAA